MTPTLGGWAVATGYRADPPARLQKGTGAYLLVHDGKPRALRLGMVAGRLLESLAHASMLTGEIGLTADPKMGRVLERLATLGFLRRSLEPIEAELPSVAVVIPAYGRATMVARCVESVRSQRYPSRLLEIVVVDDASDDCGETAEAACAQRARVITLEQNVGPAAAREAGLRASKSELVAFIDTDCVASSDWLLRLVLELADPALCAAASRVSTEAGTDSISTFESVRSPLDMGDVFGDLDPRGPRFFIPTANMVARRADLEKCGGFTTELRVGEDVDLCLRLMAAGGRIRYLPEPLVRHEPPQRARDIANRRYAYGCSESFLWGRHPVTRSGIRMSIPRLLGAISIMAALRRHSWALAIIAVGVLLMPTARRAANDRAGALGRLREPGFVLGRVTSTLTNLSRYHATTLLIGEAALRRSVPVVAPACIVGSAVCDYSTLHPPVGVATYVPLHVLEDLAYSSGVTAGALRRMFLLSTADAMRRGLEARTSSAARRVWGRIAG